MNSKAFISMQGITKTFGSVIANKNVNLTVNNGEIHALLGENGAGKSTLMNMLSGVYIPDGGSIFIHGTKVSFTSPKDSINAGIGMIHQHFKLVDVLTAKENIMLGQKTGFFQNKKKLSERIMELSNKYGLNIDPDKKVYNMSVGEKQTLEILKVLYRGANILILDEPTAVLTPQETKNLFKIMKKMRESGCAVIFISHKMNEVMEVADRVTVLRKGETITTVNKEDTNPQKLTELMVGRPVVLSIERVINENKSKILEVENLTCIDSENVKKLRGISFDLYSGEILGVAGIAGSGQKEICEAIAGLYPIKEGKILFKGDDLVGKTPREIITKGVSMSFIPEDRLGMGLIPSMDIVSNLILKQYQKQKGFLINRKPSEQKAHEIVKKLEIKTPGINHPIKELSGGNIQKVLLGRELDINPDLLITAYPVRGLDINTCYKIYDLLNTEKKKGVGILYIAEDLDALIELSDRIMVLSGGEISGIVDADKTTKEEIGLLMLGEKFTKREGVNVD
ncbi:nucleoside ABC transporter ATP-binding protein [Desulfonispora thiosulfatigenes DSM 11270]|uniref:Nucleoside ABC transporter ATP-binding protein n=1 Tax=Desulfonispora thiosulfatigenes DSM 11270 TaxID=656914 RepID=A0A1W1VF24_DESTI|nr:ABC transporter ATP-binding protein [Desulfonispora thiosulfatigenes]SMB91574.1 nucleoside ABC transporter ATP-binding protein [Desulfonispora thiosulfatigenes DSM 11270]